MIACTHVAADGNSAIRVHGRGGLGDAGSCVQPIRLVCEECGWTFYKQCYTSRASQCEPCSTLKRGDLAAVGRSGVTGVGQAFFATLTAPGERPTLNGFRIRWDRSRCSHDDTVACDGRLGCVSDLDDLADWNAGVRKRWSYFQQFMIRELMALTGLKRNAIDVQVMSTWEPQQRGALHRHMLFRVHGPVSQRTIARAFRNYRDHHDWGRQYDLQALDVSNPQQVARKAGYVAKYVTKSSDELRAVPAGHVTSGRELSPVRAPVRRERFRSWSCSRGWGDTLAMCRARRVQWAGGGGVSRSGGPGPGPGGGAALDSYQQFSTASPIGGSVLGAVAGFVAM